MPRTQATRDVLDALQRDSPANGSFGAVDVSTTAVEVLPDNPDREGLLIQVIDGGPVFIGFDSTVSTTSGVRLPSDVEYAEGAYTGPLFGVTGSGTADVRFQEVTE